jgi:hypothetical protein
MRQQIMATIDRDVKFLAHKGIYGYSLYVSIQEKKTLNIKSLLQKKTTPQVPYGTFKQSSNPSNPSGVINLS